MTRRSNRPRNRRRIGWPTWVAVALLLTPLLEVFLIVQVGQLIGAWPTVLLLVVESAIGAYLLRREGPAAWRRLQGALRAGRMPSNELADAALVLVGGTLLLAPGFATDLLGFFCVLPPTRPLARRVLLAALRRRVVLGGGRRMGPGVWGWTTSASRSRHGDVVRGEVVDDGVVEGEVADGSQPRSTPGNEDRPRPGG